MAYTYDNKNQSTRATSNPHTLALTTGSGTTLVVVKIFCVGATPRTNYLTSPPTYNGTACTFGGYAIHTSSPECNVEMWYLLAPDIGAYSVSVPNSGGRSLQVVASSYKSATGISGLKGSVLTKTGLSSSPTGDAHTGLVAGNLVVSFVGSGDNTFAPTNRSGESLYETDTGSYGFAAQYSIRTDASDYTPSWTEATSDDWQMVSAVFEEIQTTISKSESTTVTDVPSASIPYLHINKSEATPISVSDEIYIYRNSEEINVYDITSITENVSLSIPTLHIDVFDATEVVESVFISIPTLYISSNDELVVEDSGASDVTPKLIYTYEESEVTEYIDANSGAMGIDDVNVTKNIEISITVGQTITSKELISDYLISQGTIFLWPGTVANIPSGWERVTALDGRFIKSIGSIGNIGNNAVSSLSTLKGYWKFISGSGTLDYSGLDHNLLVGAGTPTYTNTIFGGGVVFDGSSYLYNPNHTDFDVGDTFSISGRIITTQATTGFFFGTYGGDYAGFCVGMVGGKLAIRVGGSSPNLLDFESTTSVNDGNEHHFLITFNKPNIKVYIDGELDNSSSFNYTLATNAKDLHIGKAPWYENYFTGTLGDLAIWNGTELTSTQATSLFNEDIEITSGGSAKHYHSSSSHNHTMASHVHSIQIPNATGSQTKNNASSGTGVVGRLHGHSAFNSGAVTSASIGNTAVDYSYNSNNPPYYEAIFITPTSDTNVLPNGVIYFYEDTDTLSGHVICNGSGTSPILGTYATGLKGYFKFDFGAVTTDSSGLSHNLTAVTPASPYKGGKYGDALSFLPMPQYYTIANHADFNPTTLSISFWIKTPVTGYNSMIFTKYGGNYKGWLVRVRSDGKVSFTIGNGGTTNKDSVSTNTVNDNVWHHVACVYNATDLRIYVDGQLDCVPVASGALVSDTAISVHLGKASWYDDNYCSGTIDDLAFWGDRSLTASEVEAIYNHGANTTPNLVNRYIKGAKASSDINTDAVLSLSNLQNYYKFDSNANDSSGNSRTATLYNTSYVAGVLGNSVRFNGSNAYATIPMTGLPASCSTISIGFWANFHEVSNESVLMAVTDDTANRLNIHFPWGDGIVYWDFGNLSAGGRVNTSSSYAGDINKWHHWVFTAGNSRMRIYRDGVQVAAVNTSSTFTKGTKVLELARMSGTTYNQTDIDNFFISTDELNPSDVRNIYENSAGYFTNLHDISHGHTVSHAHSSATSGGATSGFTTNANENVPAYSHTHGVALNSNSTAMPFANLSPLTPSEIIEPTYIKLLAIQNQTSNGIRRGMIGLWIENFASIPWNCILLNGNDGTTDIRNRYPKITDATGEIGNTGGSNTHTHASQSHSHINVSHTHTFNALSHSATTKVGDGSTGYPDAASVTHAAGTSGSQNYSLNSGNTTADSAYNEPLYITVGFIKLDFIKSTQSIQAKAQIVSGPSGYDETTVTDAVYVARDSENIEVYDELSVDDSIETLIPILHAFAYDESEVTDVPEIDEGHEFIDVYDDVNITEDISILITTRQDVTARGNISNPVYPYPNGLIFIWNGNDADIPLNWERVTTLDWVYPKGTANGVNPNVTGGNATHSHTLGTHTHTMTAHSHTGTVGQATSGIGTGSGTGNAGQNHIHTATVGNSTGGSLTGGSGTYSTVSNEPPYYTVIFITPTLTQKYFPDNAIYLYDETDSKSGHYLCDGNNSTPNLVDKFLKGDNGTAAGDTGGSTANTHTLTHTHTVENHSHSLTTGTPSIQVSSDSSTGQTVGFNHTHSATLTTTDNISSTNPSIAFDEVVQPAYKKLLTVQNQETDINSVRLGMIGMWLGTLANIPHGWILCDGSNGTQDMRGQYLKSTSTTGDIGSTGGSNTHSHTGKTHTHSSTGHTHSATLSHPSNTGDEDESASPIRATAPTDTHSFSTTSASPTYSNTDVTSSSSNNEPSYRTVAFIKLDTLEATQRVVAKAKIEVGKNVHDETTVTDYVSLYRSNEEIDVYDTTTLSEHIEISIPTLHVNSFDSTNVSDSVDLMRNSHNIYVNDIVDITESIENNIPILHININDETIVTDIGAIGGYAQMYAKACIKVLDVTQTIDGKASLMTKIWQDVEAKARINRTYTQTIYVKANIFRTGIINPPIFGDITMPFPSEANINPIWEYCENTVLKGTTYRGYRARKYEYSMKWKYMRVIDYNNLKNKVDELEPQIFTFGKWPQSVNGVLCFSTLSARRLEVGTGDSDYWSSVSIKLVEVNSRI